MAVSPQSPGLEFQRSVRAHRATLDRLLDRRSVLGMRRYFDQAQDRLERMLARQARGAKHEALSPIQAQQLLQQVRSAQQLIARQLAQRLMPILTEAQVEGIDQTDQTLAKVEDDTTGGFIITPLAEPSIKARIAERRAVALEQANDAVWLKFGTALAIATSESLAVSLATGETAQDAVSRLRAATDREWWKAERIIHTEAAQAFNQAQSDAIEETALTVRGLEKRWCELVDDETGRPLDNRVGNDSLVLHGQVVEASGVFVMPPDPSVHRSFWNQTWSASPNRPNDRSVTMPWRPEWGVPGWRWINGQRVPVNRRA